MLYRKTFVIVLVLFVASCSGLDGANLPKWLGYKRMFLYGVPEGNDSFSKGWRDGCDTSLATAGIGSLKLIKEKINAENSYQMLEDPRYDRGFTIGSGYCVNFLDYNSG